MDRLSTKGQMIDQINLGNIDSSSFDRRNHNFLSCKLGKLVPTRVDEVYPGDRIVGHVEAVANFEPLVAPIMGSLVMKQESFYIPTSILWKNAHKFFTGKHDYNGSVPSVSPWTIYQRWTKLDDVQIPDLRLFEVFDNFTTFHPDQFVQYWRDVCGLIITKYTNFGNTYQVLDILKPIIDEFQRAIDGDLKDVFDTYSDLPVSPLPTVDQMRPVVLAVLNSLYKWFNYFFGVSSFIDYIGLPAFDNIEDLFFKEGTDSNGVYYPSFINFMIYPSTTLPISSDHDLFSDLPMNWLPMRAAYVCWYWNYRDQLLETAALDPESDTFLQDIPTADEIRLLTLLRVRCWYKDTFTTALTNTGDANLIVPTTLSAEEEFEFKYYDSSNQLVNTKDAADAFAAGATVCQIDLTGGSSYRIPINYLSYSRDSSGTSSITSSFGVSLDLFDRIRRLRNFIQKRLILGYEYDDMVWSSFRVKLSNVRMRIPELLARGRDEVVINTIVNNTNTSEQDAGDKTAIAYCHGRSSDINYFAEEHGYFISFVTIMPLQSYAGGLQRLWMRQEQFDFMWPEFATMGMDAIYNYELSAPRGNYAKAGLTDEVSLQVFGYQGRYYDLKSRQDEEHGRLRTDLNYMTFSREFNMDNKPKLNYQFVHCWPALDMFVTDDLTADVVKCMDVFHSLDFQRRLPVPSEFI